MGLLFMVTRACCWETIEGVKRFVCVRSAAAVDLYFAIIGRVSGKDDVES